jgi:hypothetical protein
VFPMKYELNSYIFLRRNSFFSGSQSEGSQSSQKVKYGHESCGNQRKGLLVLTMVSTNSAVCQLVFKGLTSAFTYLLPNVYSKVKKKKLRGPYSASEPHRPSDRR